MKSGRWLLAVLAVLMQPMATPARTTGPSAPLRATPLMLEFGEQVPGTVAAYDVALRNFGSAEATNVNIAPATNGNFAHTSTCGTSLAPGANCVITLRFQPAAAGQYAANLVISSNGSPVTVTMAGAGAAPRIETSTNALNLGTRPINTTSAPQAIEIRNTGRITVGNFALIRDFPGFDDTNNCTTLGPGDACTFAFTVSPSIPGTLNRVYTISSDAGNHTLALTATGVETATFQNAGQLSASPVSLNLGSLPVGTAGDAKAITFSLDGGAGFTAAHRAFIAPLQPFDAVDVCPAIQNAGSPCAYRFRFSPTSAGPFSSTAIVRTSRGQFELLLHGTGEAPRLEAVPRLLDFGIPNTIETQTVTLRNTGTQAIPLISAEALATPFSISNGCDAGLLPGASCDVALRYAPGQRAGRSTATAVLRSLAGELRIGLVAGDGPANVYHLPIVQR